MIASCDGATETGNELSIWEHDSEVTDASLLALAVGPMSIGMIGETVGHQNCCAWGIGTFLCGVD